MRLILRSHISEGRVVPERSLHICSMCYASPKAGLKLKSSFSRCFCPEGPQPMVTLCSDPCSTRSWDDSGKAQRCLGSCKTPNFSRKLESQTMWNWVGKNTISICGSVQGIVLKDLKPLNGWPSESGSFWVSSPAKGQQLLICRLEENSSQQQNRQRGESWWPHASYRHFHISSWTLAYMLLWFRALPLPL